MAFPAVVGTPAESNVTADDTTPFTVTRVAGVSGQLTIAILAVDGNPTLGWPAGYTVFATSVQASSKVETAYHQEDGTEGTTFDVTSDASEKWAAIVYSISGAENPSTQAPESAILQAQSTTATPDGGPSLSPTGGAKDYLWISVLSQDGEEADDDTWANSAPANYTNLLQKTTAVGGIASTNVEVASSRRELNAASDDPGTYSCDTSWTYGSQTLAIHPAAAVTEEWRGVHYPDRSIYTGPV